MGKSAKLLQKNSISYLFISLPSISATEPGPSGSSVGAGRPTSKQPPPDLGNRLSPTRRSLPPVAIHQENRHRAG